MPAKLCWCTQCLDLWFAVVFSLSNITRTHMYTNKTFFYNTHTNHTLTSIPTPTQLCWHYLSNWFYNIYLRHVPYATLSIFFLYYYFLLFNVFIYFFLHVLICIFVIVAFLCMYVCVCVCMYVQWVRKVFRPPYIFHSLLYCSHLLKSFKLIFFPH